MTGYSLRSERRDALLRFLLLGIAARRGRSFYPCYTKNMVADKRATTITWRSPEFIYQPKGWLWYGVTAVGFLVATVAIGLAGNWVGSLVVVAAAVLFYRHAVLRPQTLSIRLGDNGIEINHRLYRYEEIESFEVRNHRGRRQLTLNLWRTAFGEPVTFVLPHDRENQILARLEEDVPYTGEMSLSHWLNELLRY